MTKKQTHSAEVLGFGAGGRSQPGGPVDRVTLTARITDPRDPDRPVRALMTPAQAREHAATLIHMAELVEAQSGEE